MLRYLLIACFVGSIIGEDNPSERIIGGIQAGRGQFPYQASLRTKNNVHFCGAVIISDRWILAAAHCTIGSLPYEVRVAVGTNDRTTGGESYNLQQIIEHPDFNQQTLENDIVLLQTAYPIAMNAMVRSIRMADSLTPVGKVATTSGWGQMSIGSSIPALLQYLDVRTLSNEDCRLRHSVQNRGKIHPTSVCTLSRVGKGTCMGDSGSPLVADNTVIGLVSWGVPCASGLPDVYTRVSSHRAWVLSTTGI